MLAMFALAFSINGPYSETEAVRRALELSAKENR